MKQPTKSASEKLKKWQIETWFKMIKEGLQESELSIGDAYRMSFIMYKEISILLESQHKAHAQKIERAIEESYWKGYNVGCNICIEEREHGTSSIDENKELEQLKSKFK